MNTSSAAGRQRKEEKDAINRILAIRSGARKTLWSVALVALACFLLAVGLRAAFFLIAPQLKFATYFPATLATAVFAGIPAAICVAALAFGVEWLIFFATSESVRPFDMEALFFSTVWAVNIGLVILIASWGEHLLERLIARERELDLLTKEFQHRGRNTYAVIEAVINRTLGDDPSRAATLAGRVRSIKHANDLMVDAHAHGVPLKTILEFEVNAHGAERVKLQGPEVRLTAQTARNLVLVIHELTTNAVKYGALSTEDGRLKIEWWREGDTLAVLWKEAGGPEVVEPTRRGFGNTLISQCSAMLGATYSETFAPQGFEAKVVLPASALA